MTDRANKPTLVIGAGVIGAAMAHELQKRGREVVLIDRDAPGRGTSFGNLASIAVTEFMPLSRPSVWRRIPGWLLDPEGPIAVRPAAMPGLTPWFWQFLLASRPSRLRALEARGAALCGRALADTQALLRELGAEGEISDTGCLSVYAGEAEFRADRERIEMLERFGFDFEVIEGDRLRDMEPEIGDAITRAVLLPDNRTVTDPWRVVTRLVDRFRALGGTLLRAEVAGIERAERVAGVRLSDGRVLDCADVVLCAGVHTARMARHLQEPVPLATERGYHTQIMAPGLHLDHSIIRPARAFMISPTGGGIRVGGTVEMAGLDAAPDWRRARITAKRAQEVLPNLRLSETTEWMGHRPAFPDTVPVLSASAKTPGLFYATGHGHLGLTTAATTAKLMGQLIAGETPEIDLTPYRIDRF